MTLTFPLKKQKYIPRAISDNFANKIFEGINNNTHTNTHTRTNTHN